MVPGRNFSVERSKGRYYATRQDCSQSCLNGQPDPRPSVNYPLGVLKALCQAFAARYETNLLPPNPQQKPAWLSRFRERLQQTTG